MDTNADHFTLLMLHMQGIYAPLVKQNLLKPEVFSLEDKELIRREKRDGVEGELRGL